MAGAPIAVPVMGIRSVQSIDMGSGEDIDMGSGGDGHVVWPSNDSAGSRAEMAAHPATAPARMCDDRDDFPRARQLYAEAGTWHHVTV